MGTLERTNVLEALWHLFMSKSSSSVGGKCPQAGEDRRLCFLVLLVPSSSHVGETVSCVGSHGSSWDSVGLCGGKAGL